MREPANTKTASAPPRIALDTWTVSAAVIFILLVVAGVFPHVSW